MDPVSQPATTEIVTPPPPVQSTPPPSAPPVPEVVAKHNPSLLIGVLVVLLLVGLGVGGLFLYSRKSSTPAPAPAPIVADAQPTAVPTVTNLPLVVTSPAEGELAVSQKISVKGKTSPNITVAIFTDSDQTSVQSSSTGDFEAMVTLQTGINSLTVTVFDDNGQEKSVSMDVVYDTAN
jgi:hypothetical protein